MKGYNFTERVRKVLSLAREEAAALSHEYVGTEHILLALVREGEGVASAVLQNLGIESEDLRDKVLSVVKPGRARGSGPDLPYTSRAKKVLELAMSAMRDLDHAYVGTEHLLLGLVAEEKGIAAQVLLDAGCDLESARNETLRLLGTEVDMSTRARVGTARPQKVVFAETTMAGLYTDQRIPSRFFKVLAAAHGVAERKQRRAINVDHVLIALLEHGEGSAITVLQHLGISVAELLHKLSASLGESDHAVGPETPVDARAMNELVAQSTREQLIAGSPALSTWHLLLAILASDGFASSQILAEAGLTRDNVLSEALRISG